MIAGFLLSGHDNDSFMLGEDSVKVTTPEEREFYHWRIALNGALHPAICQKCGRKTDPNFVNPDFNLRKKKMDISSTYDGYTIVSERFREFCVSQKLTNVEFVSLPSQVGHYWLRPHIILEIDCTKSLDIKFLYYCDSCKAYAGVFGPMGLRFVGIESIIPYGLYRSDIEFAQSHEQSCLKIVSPELAASIKSQKFKGACLNKIEW